MIYAGYPQQYSFGAMRPPGAPAPGLGATNPAAEKCAAMGGTSKTIEEPAGARGVCVFPDGSSCDEWALYRGECRPGVVKAGAGALPWIAGGVVVLAAVAVYAIETKGPRPLRR
jgi:hypothetical protein